MGTEPTIAWDRFPNQDQSLFRRRVRVCFNLDTRYQFSGTVLRADVEEPFRTIIKLDDGRVVLSTECQYRPLD